MKIMIVLASLAVVGVAVAGYIHHADCRER